MATLNTVFKQVFSEGLKEEGFVKIKGGQPYLVRVIGDEIIHVITCRNKWSGEPGLKEFKINAGIATVYRGSIDLKKSPSYNINWLKALGDLYYKSDPVNFNQEYKEKIFSFVYKTGDDATLRQAMEEALCETKNVIVPILNGVMELDDCISFIRRYNSSFLTVPEYDEERDNFGYGFGFNEGLLYIKTDNHDDFIEINNKILEEELKAIEAGNSLWKIEKLREIYEEGRLDTIKYRDKIYDNPRVYARTLEELEQRKERNLKALRACGLDV